MYQAVLAATREVAIRCSARVKFLTWFLLGLSVGLLMVVNSQLTGDQVQLLNLGWQLSHNHVWLPHGMITSAGGFSPGGFAGLLVAAPLYLWNDYRAPALFTLTCHAGAFLLLIRALRPALSELVELNCQQSTTNQMNNCCNNRCTQRLNAINWQLRSRVLQRRMIELTASSWRRSL